MVTIARAAQTYAKPKFVIRITDDHANSATNQGVGSICEDLFFVGMILDQGPRGSQALMRAKKHAIATDPDLLADEYQDKIISIEARARDSNNKAVQEIVFRGNPGNRGMQFSETANGVDITLRDFWFYFEDKPVVCPSRNKNAGQVLRELDQGFYVTNSYDYITPGISVTQTAFNPPLWPVTDAGVQLAHIDPALFDLKVSMTGVAIEGQPLSEVLAYIIQRCGLTPDLRYDGSTVYVTGRKSNIEHELIIGTPDDTGSNEPDIKGLSGGKDNGQIVNRIYGFGDYERQAGNVSLSPAWVPTDATPAAYDTYDSLYNQTVGRLYRYNGPAWPFDAQSHTVIVTGYTPEPGSYSDQMIVWKFNPVTSAWEPAAQKAIPIAVRDDGSTAGTILDIDYGLDIRLKKGFYLYFPDRQIDRYYTTAQQVQRAAGTYVDPTYGWSQFEAQLVRRGNRIRYDTGIRGDFPRERSRVHRNEGVTKLITGTRYRVSGLAGYRTRIAVDDLKGFDDTPYLKAETLDMVDKTKAPQNGYNITLNRIDLGFRKGDKITALLDKSLDPVPGFENLDWVIEAVNLDGEHALTQRTILTTSNSLARIQRGEILPPP